VTLETPAAAAISSMVVASTPRCMKRACAESTMAARLEASRARPGRGAGADLASEVIEGLYHSPQDSLN
jgi:hypothetical protein